MENQSLHFPQEVALSHLLWIDHKRLTSILSDTCWRDCKGGKFSNYRNRYQPDCKATLMFYLCGFQLSKPTPSIEQATPGLSDLSNEWKWNHTDKLRQRTLNRSFKEERVMLTSVNMSLYLSFPVIQISLALRITTSCESGLGKLETKTTGGSQHQHHHREVKSCSVFRFKSENEFFVCKILIKSIHWAD